MPPQPRLIPRFAAEPPHEGIPYGRWAQTLMRELQSAWDALDTGDEDLGERGEIAWYPDRAWNGWTYTPATCPTSGGYELLGYVRFRAGESPAFAHGDYTDQTAARNPGWQLDLCEQEIGVWKGQGSATATMTLVWGRALRAGGRIATAELGGVTVDQCALDQERFTLIAPDDYLGDLLEVKLWDAKGNELARESLYEEERGSNSL